MVSGGTTLTGIGRKYVLSIDFEALGHLVDPTLDLVIEDECDKDVLDFLGRDFELLCKSGGSASGSFRYGRTVMTHASEVDDLDGSVGLDDLEDPLRAEAAQDVVDVATNESVLHDRRTIVLIE